MNICEETLHEHLSRLSLSVLAWSSETIWKSGELEILEYIYIFLSALYSSVDLFLIKKRIGKIKV